MAKRGRKTISRITGRRSSATQGFTLIELLLVVTLICVLASVVLPRLKGSVRSAGLREGAQDMADVIRFARAEAMRRRLKTRFNVNASGSEYWLEVQNAETAYEEQFTAFDDPLLDTWRSLPRGLRVERISEGEQVVRNDAIVFNPDGVSVPCVIGLTDETERRTEVRIGPWFDEVTVVEHQGDKSYDEEPT